ncbi:hypothetical protein PSHT_07126 [Puccinia striiformis]|uniref:Uncharacterized protein n=1 Tax=Puccinia striiformis TaxID=27350 RepID=A0A2S4W088_9BASI|nr:hypothetical protein PSHT_07126 [Puccinia striiformis]
MGSMQLRHRDVATPLTNIQARLAESSQRKSLGVLVWRYKGAVPTYRVSILKVEVSALRPAVQDSCATNRNQRTWLCCAAEVGVIVWGGKTPSCPSLISSP